MFTSTFVDSRARLLGGVEEVAPARAGLGERIIKIDLILLSLHFHYHRPILDHHITLKYLTLSLTLTLLDLDPDLEGLDSDLGLLRCQGTPTLPSTSDPP